jgi:hypothetical protein
VFLFLKPSIAIGSIVLALMVSMTAIGFNSAISLVSHKSNLTSTNSSTTTTTMTTTMSVGTHVFNATQSSSNSSIATQENETITKYSNQTTNWSKLLSSESRGQLCDSNMANMISKLRIAVVKPVFTASAYQWNGFYNAYNTLGSSKTTNEEKLAALKDFQVRLSNSWGFSGAMANFVSSNAAKQCGLVLGKNVQIITDVDIANGTLFYPNNGSARFDVVTLVFDEYVTSSEYDALYHFVSSGGSLILMDSCNFVAEVRYNQTSNIVTFVKGHGWEFNGSAAWSLNYFERWSANNTNWVGSTFCCFKRLAYRGAQLSNSSNFITKGMKNLFGNQTIFTDYASHEENSVTNMTNTSIIASFIQTKPSNLLVASYIHLYKRGVVIHIGFMSDDIFGSDSATQDFYILSLFYTSTR